jgi:hypothetical protein
MCPAGMVPGVVSGRLVGPAGNGGVPGARLWGDARRVVAP